MLSSRRNPVLRLALPLLLLTLAACSQSSDPDALSGSTTTQAPGSTSGDNSRVTVVLNANVHTVDASAPTAEAFAYDSKGTIIAVGSAEEVAAKAGENPIEIDAQGQMVLPGFQDAHLHVPEAGINEGLCLVDPGLTLDEYADTIAGCAEEQPESDWVRVAGASLFGLRETDGTLPIDVLDEIVADRPALVLDDLGHAAWTNTLGLEAAGITQDSPDPQGGVYYRDPESGQLTGLLLENAQQAVRTAARLSDDENYEGLLVALKELGKNGVTSVSDAGGYWQQGHSEAWKRAQDEGTLTVRAANTLYLYPDLGFDAQIAEFKKRFSNDPASMLRFNTAKIYIDGILDLGTAALLAPYDTPVDPATPSGFYYFQKDELQRYVNELHKIGYRLNFHVIGDAATREALDVLEASEPDAASEATHRDRLTHVYMVDPADLGRFAHLGVIADFQVGEESTSTDYHEYLSEFIGDRAYDLIPVAKVLDTGAHVSLSSDWDADLLSPFGIIQRAVTRDTNAVPSVEKAIELVTIDAAYALGQDDTTGSISVGKQADYVIVDQDLLNIDQNEIEGTQVIRTVVGGKTVYEGK